MKTAVFSIHNYEKTFLIEAAKGYHDLLFISESLNAETAKLAKGCEAICIFVMDIADGNTLEKLYKLGVKYITLRSAGYNNVDLRIANKLGLKVAHVAAYSASAVAEHAVALMLALNRRLVLACNQAHQFNFSLEGLLGFDMKGKTVGIIGTGKIGSQTARILQGFGCRILAYDLVADKELMRELKIEYVALPQLFAQSDIITIHTPQTEQTRYLIQKDTIAQMKKGVMLINTARGSIVNTIDVIAGLKSGTIAYLGIDVYENEQDLFFEDHSCDSVFDTTLTELMELPNVIVTGHQAFLTINALENIAKATVQNLNCFASAIKSDDILV